MRPVSCFLSSRVAFTCCGMIATDPALTKVSIEQPHDHHERAPIKVTGTRLITIDSGNTASVNTFNSGFFESWKSGEDEWPMMLRPNLYITVAPAARVEGSDHQTPQQEDRNEG